MITITPGGFLKSVAEDASPKLGGDLDGQSLYDLVNIVDGTFSGTGTFGKVNSGDGITDARATRALNLISTDAVLRVWRSTADTGLAPSVDLIWGTGATDNVDGNYYWDFFVYGVDGSFNIRDRSYGQNNIRRLIIDTNGRFVFDQGADDGSIISVKSSDVAHGMTALAPTDVYGYFKKRDAGAGGLLISGLNDLGTTQPFKLQGLIGSATPTAGVSVFVFDAYKKNGTSVQTLAAGDTAFQFQVGGAAKITIMGDGDVGVGIAAPSAKLDVNSDILRLRTAKTPATAGAAGNAGDLCWDAGYIYACVAASTWKRAALVTW